MKRRIAPILAFACAIALQASVAQVAAQESAQTVRAAIPPQGRPATPLPPPPRADLAPTAKGSQEAEAVNVRIEVTISYQAGSGAPVRRSATLTVADQGMGSLRAGNQVAVPSTTFVPAATAKSENNTPAPPTPMTSFSYRSVGMNVDARRVYIQGDKTKMDLSIEFSAVDEKAPDASGRPPSFPTFSQNLTVVLESGKPMMIAQSSDFVDNMERKQSVEVKATILR